MRIPSPRILRQVGQGQMSRPWYFLKTRYPAAGPYVRCTTTPCLHHCRNCFTVETVTGLYVNVFNMQHKTSSVRLTLSVYRYHKPPRPGGTRPGAPRPGTVLFQGKQDSPPQSTFAPDPAPVKLDAPPPSRSAPHKLDLQPQYGIRPTIAHRPNPHLPQSAPVKLDALPPSRSAPHKLDLQPQYGIRPTIAWTHRPLPDPPPHKLDLQPQYGIPPRTEHFYLKHDIVQN